MSENKLQNLVSEHKNVLFYKEGCPFCIAAQSLFDTLVEKEILSGYNVYYLDKDFTNEELTDLVKTHGWTPGPHQEFCTKPQIFVEEKLIGGNREFYKSKYNQGEEETGQINGKEAPKLTNPMRF
jgi:glutaredoxin